MKGNDRTQLTLEERLALVASSQASSPEAAARLVQRFSRIHTATLFAGSADHNLMCDLTGQYWDSLGSDLMHYSGFCRSIQMALEDDFVHPADQDDYPDPYHLVWGARVNNAIVLLGLMLLDHAKGKRRSKDIYRCMRMTLGQYLDALTNLAFSNDEAAGLRFRIWQDSFLKEYDYSMPLADVLADILRRYIDGWQEFDHLDHILRCMGALACYLEEMSKEELPPEDAKRVRHFRATLSGYSPDLEDWTLVEADKRYLDPCGYYFTLANEYPSDMPDLGDKAVAARTIRSQIYLPDRDYSPAVLRPLAALSPSSDLQALLEKYISEDRLSSAMAEVHTAVMNLFMLWVEPYLRMEERLQERKPGDGTLYLFDHTGT